MLGLGDVEALTFQFYVLLTFREHTLALCIVAVIVNGVANPALCPCHVSPAVR